MYARRIIIHLLFIMGMLSFGCTSNHQNAKEPSGDLNQVDHFGQKQGPWEINTDNVLVARGSYVDGKKDGLWTSWYKNGQMKEEGRYKGGVKYGMWVEWYQDGDIMWKGEWKNGVRQLENLGAKAEISIIGQEHMDDVLAMDSLYRLKIRVLNIPASNLFVEVSSGAIIREEDSGLYTLNTSSDSMFTMAIGYIPDLNFMDFRNLVEEIEFKLK
jgi:antitoxin component YwqK of YwqJK toxin-antitoxin module